MFRPIQRLLELVDDYVPSQVITFLSWVSSVLTIISVLLSVLSDVFGLTPLGGIVFLRNRPYLMLGICVITIVMLVCSTYHYYRDGKKRLELFTNEYHVALHRFRNLDYMLKQEYVNCELDKREIAHLVKKYSQIVIDSVCLQLEQVTRHNIAGCIKLVNPEKSADRSSSSAIGEQTVSDFVRSETTNEKRKKFDPDKRILIKDNTDFIELMDPNNTRIQFYQPNLLQYEKRLKEDDHEYMNSTHDWKEKYRSTAVAPIQIDSKFLPDGKEGVYRVIGFLCVDSMEIDALPLKHKKPITSMLKAYSDLLYCVLDIYSEYLKLVSENEYMQKYVEKNYPAVNGFGEGKL